MRLVKPTQAYATATRRRSRGSGTVGGCHLAIQSLLFDFTLPISGRGRFPVTSSARFFTVHRSAQDCH